MSKILSLKEAEDIANKMCAAMGFSPVKVRCRLDENNNDRAEIYHLVKKTRKVDKWWSPKLKDEIYEEVVVLYSADCSENVLLKLEKFLVEGGQARADKADNFRKKYADLLLDEELHKDG